MEINQFKQTDHLPDFGKVAVIMGGVSAEREISMLSGKAVVESLKRSGVNVTGFEVRDFSYLTMSQMQHFDRVFIALHGPGGEDGKLQGLLSSLGVRFTGSGVLGSALAMDKVKSKQIWSAVGLNTPKSWVLNGRQEIGRFIEKLKSSQALYPLIVKPLGEGSSLGMSKVEGNDDVLSALEDAFSYGDIVLVEPFLPGPEYTVGILKGVALPSIRIETKREFYDYHAKYVDDDTKFLVPSGLGEAEEREIGELALEAFTQLRCSGWGRVDIMRDVDGRFSLIEVNTIPGLTSHSLVPKACQSAGIGFDEMILHILDTASVANDQISKGVTQGLVV